MSSAVWLFFAGVVFVAGGAVGFQAGYDVGRSVGRGDGGPGTGGACGA